MKTAALDNADYEPATSSDERMAHSLSCPAVLDSSAYSENTQPFRSRLLRLRRTGPTAHLKSKPYLDVSQISRGCRWSLSPVRCNGHKIAHHELGSRPSTRPRLEPPPYGRTSWPAQCWPVPRPRQSRCLPYIPLFYGRHVFERRV
jgi:hypothetical protein